MLLGGTYAGLNFVMSGIRRQEAVATLGWWNSVEGLGSKATYAGGTATETRGILGAVGGRQFAVGKDRMGGALSWPADRRDTNRSGGVGSLQFGSERTQE